MAQPTEVYVDPAIAADSGTGTINDPYGDLEYAIEQTTFDTTNGTRVNIKSGTDEVLAAQLETALSNAATTPAWVPTQTAPCVFQGYTSTAGDGGQGGISGGGSVAIISSTRDFIHFIDLHLHNCGSNTIVNLDNQCSVIRCEIDNTTGAGIDVDIDGVAFGNYVHNCGGVGITVDNGVCAYNYLVNGTNDFTTAISVAAGGERSTSCYRNIIQVDGATDGILFGPYTTIFNNSIFSNGGTGQGILPNAVDIQAFVMLNNIVEGFSGAGGVGFDLSAQTGSSIRIYGGNCAFNNTTDFNAPSDYSLDDWKGTGNETLASSAFTDPANGDFAPLDVGSVKEGSIPENFGDL